MTQDLPPPPQKKKKKTGLSQLLDRMVFGIKQFQKAQIFTVFIISKEIHDHDSTSW